MVDIGEKADAHREAVASGFIQLQPGTVEKIRRGEVEKGDPLRIAELAGILAAKQASTLIPLAHPIPLTKVDVQTEVKDDGVEIVSHAKTVYKTGCELEALVATAVALLTVFDVIKQYEKDERGQYPIAAIRSIKVINKIVGK